MADQINAEELTKFFTTRFPDVGRVDLDTDFDDDLVVTVSGLTTRYDHLTGTTVIVAKTREYEVEATLTTSVRFTVVANNDEQAQEFAEAVVSELCDDVNVGEPSNDAYSTWTLEHDGPTEGEVDRVSEQ